MDLHGGEGLSTGRRHTTGTPTTHAPSTQPNGCASGSPLTRVHVATGMLVASPPAALDDGDDDIIEDIIVDDGAGAAVDEESEGAADDVVVS